MARSSTRIAVVTVPQWPLIAALERHRAEQEAALERTAHREQRDAEPGKEPQTPQTPQTPVVLLHHHRVLAVDDAARQLGILPGMRRRAARAACPEALLLEAEEDAENALFEMVAAAVDTVAAGVDTLRPGTLLMAAAGPARHQGGEEALAEALIDAVADHTGWSCTVGIADGPFAALLAAETGRIIHPGRSADYLAPHPISALLRAPVGRGWGREATAARRAAQSAGQSPARRRSSTGRDRGMHATLAALHEMVGLLQRLGIRTLGDFAALESGAVTDRFGPGAGLLHLLARGQEAAPPAAHHPAQPLQVDLALENPLERTDQAAFVARPLAERLRAQLVERGLVCTRLQILARTASGQELERTWRHDGALDVEDMVERIRWQCDGWLTRSRMRARTLGAITHLSLVPVQVMPAGLNAPGLWGEAGEETHRAQRAFARAQALAGEQAVLVPVTVGGRLLAEETVLVPWRQERPAARQGPWPGALHGPAPATVLRTQTPLRLLDTDGEPVVVTARGLLSAVPVRLLLPEVPPALSRCGIRASLPLHVTGYGQPVLLDERWWGPSAQRAARLQLTARTPEEQDLALVLLCRRGAWSLEGLYD